MSIKGVSKEYQRSIKGVSKEYQRSIKGVPQKSFIVGLAIRGDRDNQVDSHGPHRCHLFYVNNLCVFIMDFCSWFSGRGLNFCHEIAVQRLNFLPLT